jgi:hypothetical protein
VSAKKKCTDTAPHVFGTHVQPPDTSVAANVKTAKYVVNSARYGKAFRRGAGKGLGVARCDTGSEIRRSSKGTRMIMDDNEN